MCHNQYRSSKEIRKQGDSHKKAVPYSRKEKFKKDYRYSDDEQ